MQHKLRATWNGREAAWQVTWCGVVVCQGPHDFVCRFPANQDRVTFGKRVAEAQRALDTYSALVREAV